MSGFSGVNKIVIIYITLHIRQKYYSIIGRLSAMSLGNGFKLSSFEGFIEFGFNIRVDKYVNMKPPAPKPALTIPDRIPSCPGKYYQAK